MCFAGAQSPDDQQYAARRERVDEFANDCPLRVEFHVVLNRPECRHEIEPATNQFGTFGSDN